MNTPTHVLINDLIEQTRRHLNQAARLQQLPLEELNWREAADRWSVLECLEHLNLYGDFYLPTIEKSIRHSTYKPATRFRSHFLGDYFARAMLPREKLNKMNTFKDKNPIGSQLSKATIERFTQQQHHTLALLDASRSVSLHRSRTATSISSFVTIKLGDAFRVVIYHNHRHMEQIKQVRRAYRTHA